MQKGLGRAVSGEEAEQLSKDATRVDGLFPDPRSSFVWYRLSNGSLLAKRSGGGRLYTPEEFEQLKIVLAEALAASEHYLGGRELPENFPSRVPAILAATSKWMGADEVTPGLEMLERLDTLCDRVGRDKCLAPPLFERVALFARQRDFWFTRGFDVNAVHDVEIQPDEMLIANVVRFRI